MGREKILMKFKTTFILLGIFILLFAAVYFFEFRSQKETDTKDMLISADTDDVDKIKSKMEELSKASHKFAEEIYKEAAKKQQEAQAKGGATTGKPEGKAEESKGKKGEDVVDAEYKVENEDEKKGKK